MTIPNLTSASSVGATTQSFQFGDFFASNAEPWWVQNNTMQGGLNNQTVLVAGAVLIAAILLMKKKAK